MAMDARGLSAWGKAPFGGGGAAPGQSDADAPDDDLEDDEQPRAGKDALVEDARERAQLLQTVVEAHLPGLSADTPPDAELAERLMDAAESMDEASLGSAMEIAKVAVGTTLDECLDVAGQLAQAGMIDPAYAEAIGTFLYYLSNVLAPPDAGADGDDPQGAAGAPSAPAGPGGAMA